MYNADTYNMLDAIKANAVALLYEEDDLETANLLERIFRDAEGLRIRLRDLEAESKEYHCRAIKADMKVRELNIKFREKMEKTKQNMEENMELEKEPN